MNPITHPITAPCAGIVCAFVLNPIVGIICLTLVAIIIIIRSK